MHQKDPVEVFIKLTGNKLATRKTSWIFWTIFERGLSSKSGEQVHRKNLVEIFIQLTETNWQLKKYWIFWTRK